MKSSLMTIMFLFCCALPANGEQVERIPLDTIWAHGMPGTRDIHELEKGTPPKSLLADQIAGVLEFLPKGKTAGKGFAVVGTEKQALANAHAVLLGKQQPRQSFSTNVNVWVIFFSHSFGQFVHLKNVERRDKTVMISYRFVPHETKQLTAHLALIPLGKLPIGKYRVDFDRPSLQKTDVDEGPNSAASQGNDRVICQPFSFEVVK